MAPTSDERREAAERLRNITVPRNAPYDEPRCSAKWYELICGAVGGKKDPWFGVSALADRLADLIDPTCEVMEVPDNDEFMVRVVSGFVCKRCGHEAIVERNCDGSAEPPRFCPHCGARVTSGGER